MAPSRHRQGLAHPDPLQEAHDATRSFLLPLRPVGCRDSPGHRLRGRLFDAATALKRCGDLDTAKGELTAISSFATF